MDDHDREIDELSEVSEPDSADLERSDLIPILVEGELKLEEDAGEEEARANSLMQNDVSRFCVVSHLFPIVCVHALQPAREICLQLLAACMQSFPVFAGVHEIFNRVYS